MGELLLISDTTHLTFPSHPSKEGLGEVGTDEMDLEGVKVHSTIGVLPTTGQMTGILDQQALLEDREKGRVYDSNGRGKPTGLESEREKWIRGDRRASSGLPEGVRPIFVHDRGADAFPVFRKLRSGIADGGFVVRANQNRCIRTADGQEARLLDWSKTLPGKGRTRIRIQQGGDRESREAVLSVKSGTCELLPPKGFVERRGIEPPIFGKHVWFWFMRRQNVDLSSRTACPIGDEHVRQDLQGAKLE